MEREGGAWGCPMRGKACGRIEEAKDMVEVGAATPFSRPIDFNFFSDDSALHEIDNGSTNPLFERGHLGLS
jgi:hypothetical protein